MPFPIDESRNQSSPEHLQLAVGQRLFNRRYELIEMLGPGGMGVVWKAHDLARQEPKPVALKFLPSILVHHEKEMKALLAEVDAGQNLRHDLIVATYGLEVEGPLAAIVLEFVAGETLKHKLEVHERGFFEPNEIESWLKDIITALTYLHEEKGVLHRDIKPANIIVDEAVKRARLMDFGISQSIQETMGRHTQTGAAQGTSNTLAYTSPEGLGLRHKPAKTDDIYSLGATVYGLLTGTPPFCQGTPEIIALHIKTEPVPNVMQRRAELVEDGMNATVGATVPSPWQAMLDACLAKDPAKRPQSVKGMDWGGAKVAVAFSRHSEATGEAESQTNLPPTAPPFQRASPLAEAPPSAKTPALKPATTRALWQRKSILMKLVAASLVCLLTYAWWAHSSAEAERLRQEGADFERRAADKLALAERAKEQAKQAGELKASLLEREKGELRQKLLDALKPKTANSLGMKFIFFLDDKLTHKQILGCIHETRVADLAAFRADPKWQNFYADSTHSNERKANLWKERGSKENHPATDVSYIDACAFCAWLTQRERGLGLIGRDDLYRLPTDLEWSMMVGIGEQEDPSLTPEERDASGAEKLKDIYPWGIGYPPPPNVGNYLDETARAVGIPGFAVIYNNIKGYSDGFATTSPVMSFPPNEKGFYDLGGNVWEWCSDWFDDNKEKLEPGYRQRVLRGNAFLNEGNWPLLSSTRRPMEPSSRIEDCGFRCVLAVDSGPSSAPQLKHH